MSCQTWFLDLVTSGDFLLFVVAVEAFVAGLLYLLENALYPFCACIVILHAYITAQSQGGMVYSFLSNGHHANCDW